MKKAYAIVLLCLVCAGSRAQNYPELKPLSPKRLEQIHEGAGVRPFQKKGLWGFEDQSGKPVVKPVFEMALPFDNFNLSKVQAWGKWGLVDKDCEYVVVPKFDTISEFNTDGFTQATLSGKTGIIDIYGRVLLNFEFDNVSDFDGSNAFILKDGKTGFINRDFKVVVAPEYDSLSNFNDSLYLAVKGGKKGLMDHQGRIIVQPGYDDISLARGGGFYIVRTAGLLGSVSLDGMVLTTPRYDVISESDYHGCMMTGMDGKTGLLGFDGEELQPAIFESIAWRNPGFFVTSKGGKFGLLSDKAEKRCEPIYDAIGRLVAGNCLLVSKDGSKGVITTDGDSYIEPEWDDIVWMDAGYWAVSRGGKYGAISNEGKRRMLLDCIMPEIPVLDDNPRWLIADGRYIRADIHKSVYMKDLDQQLFAAASGKMEAYAGSTEIPTCAKSYIAEAMESMRKENEKAILDDPEHVYNHLNNNIFAPEKFVSSSKTLEENAGGNIYTHTIYSAIQKGSDPYGWISWINDSRNENYSLMTRGGKVSASAIAARITRNKYRKVFDSRYNSAAESNVVLYPTSGFEGDGGCFYVIFHMEFIGNVKMTPSEIGAPSAIISLYETVGRSYDFIMEFDEHMEIKGHCILPFGDNAKVSASAFGGFYCYYGGGVAKGSNSYPLVRFDENCKFQQWFSNESEYIFDICEDEKNIYLGGSTKKEGYVGFDNPLLYSIDRKTFGTKRYNVARKAAIKAIWPSESGILALHNDTGKYEIIPYGTLGVSKDRQEELTLKTSWDEFEGMIIGGCGLWDAANHRWRLTPVYEKPEDGSGFIISGDWKISTFSEGLAAVGHNGKFGYVDESGKLVIPFKFDEAGAFKNDTATVSLGGTIFNIDRSGKKL